LKQSKWLSDYNQAIDQGRTPEEAEDHADSVVTDNWHSSAAFFEEGDVVNTFGGLNYD
jgi:hypothetical protein